MNMENYVLLVNRPNGSSKFGPYGSESQVFGPFETGHAAAESAVKMVNDLQKAFPGAIYKETEIGLWVNKTPLDVKTVLELPDTIQVKIIRKPTW